MLFPVKKIRSAEAGFKTTEEGGAKKSNIATKVKTALITSSKY